MFSRKKISIFGFFLSIKYKRFRLIKSFSEYKAKGATEMPKFVMVSSRKPSVDVKGKNKIATFYLNGLTRVHVYMIESLYYKYICVVCC